MHGTRFVKTRLAGNKWGTLARNRWVWGRQRGICNEMGESGLQKESWKNRVRLTPKDQISYHFLNQEKWGNNFMVLGRK